MSHSKKIITHIHSRITQLAPLALDAGLIVRCERTESDTYFLQKPNELVPTESTPIATAVTLLLLLNQLKTSDNG